jgi:putative endonuclease
LKFIYVYGAVPKWLKGKLCKSFIRRFESDRRLYFKSLQIMFTVYILKSLKDNKRYIGYTENLTRRLNEHNSGETKSIKGRLPFKVIYTEVFENKSEAMEREKFFKTHPGRDFLDSIGK